jgi:hypothetical protein
VRHHVGHGRQQIRRDGRRVIRQLACNTTHGRSGRNELSGGRRVRRAPPQ